MSFSLTKFNYPRLHLKNKNFLLIVYIFIIGILLALTKSLFVAAIVNGTPISRVAIIKELEGQGGRAALNGLIERALIFQEAKKLGVSVSKETLEAQIASIEEILKGQNLTLDDALKARGQTRQKLSEQIRLQKTVESILAQKINITEEDIANYYEENKEFLDEGTTLEGAKEKIKQQLFQQKLSEEYSKWIEGLKTKAKIYYLVKYI